MENTKVKYLYVNIPIKDVSKTRAFWAKLGFTFDERFSNEKAICMILQEGRSYVMMISYEMFETFTDRSIFDGTTTQVLLSISLDSRKAVDEMVALALENGGTRYMDPIDMGWMYYDRFIDINGHQWEIMYGDENQMPK